MFFIHKERSQQNDIQSKLIMPPFTRRYDTSKGFHITTVNIIEKEAHKMNQCVRN